MKVTDCFVNENRTQCTLYIVHGAWLNASIQLSIHAWNDIVTIDGYSNNIYICLMYDNEVYV